MMARKKNDQTRVVPETLGLKLLQFGRRKTSSRMNLLARIYREAASIIRLKTFERPGYRMRRNWNFRGREPITFRYFSPPLLFNFQSKKLDSQFDRASAILRNMQHLFSRTSALANKITKFRSGEVRAADHIAAPFSKLVSFPPIFPTAKIDDIDREKSQFDHGKMLPEPVLNSFSNRIGIRLPQVKINQDRPSDKFLDAHHADAMTIGRDIFFRTGKFDLYSNSGLGLLGHELTHVAQQQSNDWRNPMVSRCIDRVERIAIENERLIFSHPPSLRSQIGQTSTAGSTSTAGPSSNLPSPARAPQPMFASTSRNDIGPSNYISTESNSVMVSDGEMERIKEEIYQDLKMRLKIEFERGA